MVDNLAQIRNAEHSGRDLALDSVFYINALLRSIDAYFGWNTLLIREEPARILLDALEYLTNRSLAA